MLRINGVEIEDTHIESCETLSSCILVTSMTKEIALANTLRLCTGLITFCPIEGFLGNYASPAETPDGRPGFLALLRGMRSMNAKTKQGKMNFEEAFTNLLSLTPHLPTVAVFDAVPREKTLFITDAGETVKRWGDGYEAKDRLNGRHVYRIPVMMGESIIEKSFRVATSFDGALELLCQNAASAFMATETAARRVQDEVEGAFVMYPLGGVNGAKIGGVNYKTQKVTSTTFLCPTIRDRVKDSRIPKGVSSVIEFLVWSLDIATVKRALRISIETIAKIQGVIKITSFNQSGLWGKHKIRLAEIVKNL